MRRVLPGLELSLLVGHWAHFSKTGVPGPSTMSRVLT